MQTWYHHSPCSLYPAAPRAGKHISPPPPPPSLLRSSPQHVHAQRHGTFTSLWSHSLTDIEISNATLSTDPVCCPQWLPGHCWHWCSSGQRTRHVSSVCAAWMAARPVCSGSAGSDGWVDSCIAAQHGVSTPHDLQDKPKHQWVKRILMFQQSIILAIKIAAMSELTFCFCQLKI